MVDVMIESRPLPHSIEAEAATLGAVLLSPQAWLEIAEIMAETDWYRDAHRRIFLAMARLAEQHVAIDFVTVKEELRRTRELDEVGGPAYLSALVDGLPHASNVRHYAALVREKARQRSVIMVGNRLSAAAYAAEDKAEGLIEQGVRDLLSLSAPAVTGESATVVQAVSDYVSTLDRAEDGDRLLTGHKDVDALIGGLRIGELTIIAARPTVGKTSFALGVLLHLALAGKRVAFFSLEMTLRALASRLLAWGTRVPVQRLERGYASEKDYALVSYAWTQLDGVPLQLERSQATLTGLAARCQRLQQESGGLAAIAVDYLQLLIPERRQRSREEEVGAISRGLKRLAQDQQLAVLAVSQLSRAPEARTDKRPHLADLRESGALEQEADVALLLFRSEMYGPTDENRGVAEVIVAKNRNGPTGVTKLAWIDGLAQFCDLARA